MRRVDPDSLGREESWDGVRAVVAGFDASGFAAADNLTHLGATVTALADGATPVQLEKAELLEILGATVEIHEGATQRLPDDVDLLVTSPGFAPDAPLLAQAAARGVPVWGEVELAWRLRPLGPTGEPAPWLCVTGAHGKTTTVRMLDAILRAAGLRSVVAGHGGLPIVEAVMDPTPYDVFVVELSAAQLHHTHSMSAQAAAVLNVGGDRPDAPDLGRIYEQAQRACVYNVNDPATEALVVEADVVEGARAVGFTLGMPGVGMLGVVEDLLVDRAFIEDRASSAAELCTLSDLAGAGGGEPDPHLVADALAAAALARAHGVTQAHVRDGLLAFRHDVR